MSVSPAIREVAWPGDRLAEALEALGRRSGFGTPGPESAPPASFPPSAGAGDGRAEMAWIDAAAGRLGLEAEPVEAPYGRVEEMLRGAPPAVLRLPGDSPSFLAVTSGGRRGVSVLGPDLESRTMAPDVVAAALRAGLEGEAGGVEKILEDAGIQGRRRARARSVLLGEMLPGRRVGGVWLLRPAGAARPGAHSREAGLPRLLAWLLGAHVAQSVLWVLSWWLLGRSALEGRLDRGWMLGWGLLLVTLIPIQVLSTAAAGLLSIRSGALLKRRLLHGAFQLDPEEVRRQGAGQLLGRAMESDVVERMAIAGGFLSITGAIEAILSLLVLGRGAGGGLQVTALLAWLSVTAWLTFRLYRRREEWTAMRIGMTNDLVERMVGHRTRLAQEPAGTWNRDEDRSLDRYLAASRRLDSAAARLQAVVPRGWFLLGTLSLAPAFIWGAPSMSELAIGIGGVLLAVQAFHHLADGLERCAAAVIAWRRIQPFWRAAGRRETPGEPCGGARPAGSEPEAMPLLDLRDIVFRYPGRPEPVLRQVALQVRRGDRILLEGPSGGGKSTLGALLAGQRMPESGLLLLDGLDRETLGSDGWRRRSVIVPQFHENHVFLGSFAFNALMGRGWPPSLEDLKEVEGICRTLGLGPLIDRMPGGILQMVGETGWQLSHGERSRLYIARALLQGPEVLILDESFAALDPETLRGTLGYVLERAPTLIVIAHP